jgi:hypothetical protein
MSIGLKGQRKQRISGIEAGAGKEDKAINGVRKYPRSYSEQGKMKRMPIAGNIVLHRGFRVEPNAREGSESTQSQAEVFWGRWRGLNTGDRIGARTTGTGRLDTN